MHRRYAALALAAALVVPTGAITAASASALSSASVTAADRGENDRSDKSGKSTRKSKKAKKAKQGRTVVLGGSVTEVDTEAGTLTFTVHGGRFKKLRGTDLTLTVPDDVRVMREGEQVTLAEVQVGDLVNVRARRTDDGFTVIRVVARAGEDSDDSEDSTEPTESPSPEDDPTTEPTSPDEDESDEDDSTDDDDSDEDGSDDEVTPTPTPTA